MMADFAFITGENEVIDLLEKLRTCFKKKKILPAKIL